MPIELNKDQIYGIKSFMAFVLRHKPHFYKIKLDNDGFADVESVLAAVKKNKKIAIEKEQLVDIVKRYSGGIFLLSENKIKAKSGHTITFNMSVPEGFQETTDVPSVLYTLVPSDCVSKIVAEGGISFSNQKISLSKNRLQSSPGNSCIHVHAQKAMSEKTKFYHNKNNDSYFVHYIASKFVSLHV